MTLIVLNLIKSYIDPFSNCLFHHFDLVLLCYYAAEKFRKRIGSKVPPHVLQVIEEELTKLQLLQPSSNEYNVTQNYLEWLTALPWGIYRFVDLFNLIVINFMLLKWRTVYKPH